MKRGDWPALEEIEFAPSDRALDVDLVAEQPFRLGVRGSAAAYRCG